MSDEEERRTSLEIASASKQVGRELKAMGRNLVEIDQRAEDWENVDAQHRYAAIGRDLTREFGLHAAALEGRKLEGHLDTIWHGRILSFILC
jgi:hypothetical protein